MELKMTLMSVRVQMLFILKIFLLERVPETLRTRRAVIQVKSYSNWRWYKVQQKGQ